MNGLITRTWPQPLEFLLAASVVALTLSGGSMAAVEAHSGEALTPRTPLPINRF